MSTKETIFIFFIIFVSGFVASQLIKADISATAVIPFLVMVGAFLGVIFNRIKHIDDLNLSRKKDVSLEFVGIMSEYGTVLISIIDQNVKPETFHSNLNKATQNMNRVLSKFHVVCSDQVSSELELINFEIVSLMLTMTQKSQKLGEDKLSLMKELITEDIIAKLNLIRYKIIHLVNSEIGDGSGTDKLKLAIDKNNTDFKNLLLKTLK